LERRLAAILAADVVGYSRLMGEDESGTLERLKALRRELVQPKITERKGRIVKLMGDGLLAEFPSVVEAVLCAVDVQRGMNERESEITDERRIRLRIGVNLGDIIVEGSDIYGDGVNVAARLEGLADPGSICVSGTVFDHVEAKVDLDFVDLGEQEVKNIEQPVQVYRITLNNGMGAKTTADALIGSATVLKLPDKPSIAVLPFDNMSGDPEQDYFTDGIVEDIITELSREPDLFVIARNSSFAYKGKSPDIREVARELGVRYVLEGSVRKTGNRIRLNAQLIKAETGHHVWAERYDRTLEDVFEVQDELTNTIQNTLLQKVRESGMDNAMSRAPKDMNAYDHMLRAFGLVLRFNRANNEEAIREAEAALDLDPSYARAHMVLAWAYLYTVWSAWTDDVEQAIERGYEAAQKAIAADRNDFWGHAALGFAELCLHHHERALSALDRALALNPNSADVRTMRGMVLNFLGRPEEGLKDIELAIRHNPHHPDWYLIGIGRANYMLGRYEEAIPHIERLVAATPELAVDDWAGQDDRAIPEGRGPGALLLSLASGGLAGKMTALGQLQTSQCLSNYACFRRRSSRLTSAFTDGPISRFSTSSLR
jgi:adenylate cyclase